MVKYIDEYRDIRKVRYFAEKIKELNPGRKINLMEVCGGHTITILKYGLRELLPENVNLISGPGCPVCVTSVDFIDAAIELSKKDGIVIATFGDLVRVPGTESSLFYEMAKGADVKICYSPGDALRLALRERSKEIVFLGIGFETTAPSVGVTILNAYENSVDNFSVLSSHKVMPPAMKFLLESGEVDINGFICPGHVSTITGVSIYEFIARDYKVPCVVSGFEPADLMESIYMLVQQISESRAEVENQYKRVVRYSGNEKAQKVMSEIFEPVDVRWRGIALIPESGLGIKEKYKQLDAFWKFDIRLRSGRENPACICGEVLKGVKTPFDCKLFGKVCTPENPVGACMVSTEGACAIYYKYGDRV
ncbi:MAG: hydrogenase formation protein HypD [Candidatus Marinimicrobia bacterium]|nr:hydrogenase formation protein HypD [Candidatus Neomarinimicrobiota bacterium]